MNLNPARSLALGNASRGVRRALDVGLEPLFQFGGGHGGRSSFHGLGPPLGHGDTGRAEGARELYRGHFIFAQQRVECHPRDVFGVRAPSQFWLDHLHGFAWLADLAAPGLALFQAFARSMVQTWWETSPPSSLAASAERLKSWSRHAQFLLAGASASFAEEYFHAASAEWRKLARLRAKNGAEQLTQAIALLTAGLAFRRGEGLLEEGMRRTVALVPLLILPDGGHSSRSPKALLEFLSDAMPLRLAMERRRLAVPFEFNAAIERALPMLRTLIHGDQGLAIFHGVEHPEQGLVREVLEADRSLGRPLTQARHSGYCRLAQGSALVIFDCGQQSVCNSGLAFEFSDGPQRIVGSCGMLAHATPAWREAAQSRAAHTAVEFSGQKNRAWFSRLASMPGKKVPQAGQADVTTSQFGMLAKGSMQYADRGLEHIRELYLASSGKDLRGEDSFKALSRRALAPDLAFCMRFHLHPSVKASADRKGSTIMLIMANGQAWRFSAKGGSLSLEESLSLSSGGGARMSQQIVIRGVAGRSERVNWAFRKLEKKAKQMASQETAPELPL